MQRPDVVHTRDNRWSTLSEGNALLIKPAAWTTKLHSKILFAVTAVAVATAPVGAQSYWGQTFTVPGTPNIFLQSVSAPGFHATQGTNYVAQIFAVDGTNLTGPSLFQQALPSSFSGFSLTPNINLTPGGLFAVVVNAQLGLGTFADQGFADGALIYCASSSTCNAISGDDFDSQGFSVQFGAATTTPEPGSLALLATGLVGLVPVARRKIRQGTSR
ncbi:MAG TPA: PEP-CTERM sorting domain-containing protein [Gemmatimonadaceae bacterium]|nr:PEP-CTERM sorting domain-containing protein [Gemmatimonadaceae bacterium]